MEVEASLDTGMEKNKSSTCMDGCEQKVRLPSPFCASIHLCVEQWGRVEQSSSSVRGGVNVDASAAKSDVINVGIAWENAALHAVDQPCVSLYHRQNPARLSFQCLGWI